MSLSRICDSKRYDATLMPPPSGHPPRPISPTLGPYRAGSLSPTSTTSPGTPRARSSSSQRRSTRRSSRTSESREEGDAEENRIDNLCKDLKVATILRCLSSHRLVPPVHPRLLLPTSTANSSPGPLQTTCHSLSFNNPLTVNLPFPPASSTSPSYTGTLVFSHRGYDLDTAFHVMRFAAPASSKR
jgi:hypothetical protein